MKFNYIPEQIVLSDTPSTPNADYIKVYKKNNGCYYELNSSGEENIIHGLPLVFEQQAITVHLSATANDRTNALTRDINIPCAGNWLLTLTFNYNGDLTTGDIVVYATLDGNALDLNNRVSDPQGNNQILRIEPKDVANSPAGAITGTASGQKYVYSKIFTLTGLTAGNKELIIDISSEQANAESAIWNIVECFQPCNII